MPDRPNVILIHADQHRGDCLGIDGHPVVKTPTLDSLARRGVRFGSFYAACPSCIAARRSILTDTPRSSPAEDPKKIKAVVEDLVAEVIAYRPSAPRPTDRKRPTGRRGALWR
jgi:hypothetical protein